MLSYCSLRDHNALSRFNNTCILCSLCQRLVIFTNLISDCKTFLILAQLIVKLKPFLRTSAKWSSTKFPLLSQTSIALEITSLFSIIFHKDYSPVLLTPFTTIISPQIIQNVRSIVNYHISLILPTSAIWFPRFLPLSLHALFHTK